MQPLLQLFTAANGSASARVSFGNDVVRHLHSTIDPDAEAAVFNGFEFFGDVIVFAGIGLGWHLTDAMPKLPDAALCIVVDYFPECISYCKDTFFKYKPNTVVYLSGQSDADAIKNIENLCKTKPQAKLQIIKHPASFFCFQEFYHKIIEQIASFYIVKKATPLWLRKKAALFFGNFFLEKELSNALKTSSEGPLLFNYTAHKSTFDFECAFSKFIQTESPDFILSINMNGFDSNGEIGIIAARYGVPIIVWFVDDPRPILLAHKSHISPNTIALCWEKSFLPFLRKFNFRMVEYVPLACDPSLFSNIQPSKPETPIGFVGTAMVDSSAGNIRSKFLWSPSYVPIVEFCSDQLVKNKNILCPDAIVTAASMFGIQLAFSDEKNMTWLISYITHYASMKKRKSLLQPLLPFGLETFGDPLGWKTLLGNTVPTHDNIDYRHGIGAIYNSIQVNINITSCQMPSTVNQRVFDIPMANSFVLSDKQSDLLELFDMNEIAFFENQSELVDMAKFYLSHEIQREAIVNAARKRILLDHTYENRVEKILSLL